MDMLFSSEAGTAMQGFDEECTIFSHETCFKYSESYHQNVLSEESKMYTTWFKMHALNS